VIRKFRESAHRAEQVVLAWTRCRWKRQDDVPLLQGLSTGRLVAQKCRSATVNNWPAPGVPGQAQASRVGIVVVVPTMPSASDKLPRPKGGRRRWTSFVAGDASTSERIRGLHDEQNPRHRLRVEHDANTLLIHLSDEEGVRWTTFAVDRATRQWSVAQADRQSDSGAGAYDGLYE